MHMAILSKFTQEAASCFQGRCVCAASSCMITNAWGRFLVSQPELRAFLPFIHDAQGCNKSPPRKNMNCREEKHSACSGLGFATARQELGAELISWVSRIRRNPQRKIHLVGSKMLRAMPFFLLLTCLSSHAVHCLWDQHGASRVNI